MAAAAAADRWSRCSQPAGTVSRCATSVDDDEELA
jgi:hypothetical protein